ncbi:MAG: hypothetical protein AAB403_17550 [Planctomycetota bacterium]
MTETSSMAFRLFVVDDKSGKAVANMAVSLAVDAAGIKGRILATLQTDGSGYASFKVPLADLAEASHLRVTQVGSGRDALVLSIADALAGEGAHTIRFDASSFVPMATHLGLPSLMDPDAVDLALSPGSIGLIPNLMPGAGLCRQLMPTGMAVRRFDAFRVLADICKIEEMYCPDTGRDGDRVHVARGTMLEYEIAWYPAGTSLGNLLNTFSLAPCERVTVAVADWMRRETASLDQSATVQQQQTQHTDHERLISETMQGTVKSKSRTIAGSMQSGASVGIPIKAVTLNLTAAFGGAFSASSSTQTTAIATASHLSDRISQEASFVASQRSTVVFQATASEQSTYQTRTVRNNNHCHTLTLMYYQVDRSYRVVTTYKGKRDVVLVQYENKDFDALRAWQNADLLRDALIDPSLREGFDALGDALFCCDKQAPPKELRMDALTITFTNVQIHPSAHFTQTMLATTNGPVSIPAIDMAGWVSGGTYTQTINLPIQVDPRTVTGIFGFLSSGFGAGLGFIASGGVEVTYHAVGYDSPFGLFSTTTPVVGHSSLSIPTNAEVPPPGSGQNPCLEASCAGNKLLAHLNGHKRYYNSLVWLGEDPNDRVMKWSCCRGQSLMSQIENTPIAVYGDFVVFPAAGSVAVNDGSVRPVTKLITMPTPGVYSEGILGQCDTCEIQDPQRFSNWKDSPCCDESTTVPGLPTTPSGLKPSDLAGVKPDAIISLLSLLAAPTEPTSSLNDLVTALLSKADDGSAEAKALLEKLIDAVSASIPAATKG